MIKYYRLLSIFMLAWLYSSGVGYAQCTASPGGQFPGGTVTAPTTSGSVLEINGCNYLGEYAVLDLADGETYEFTVEDLGVGSPTALITITTDAAPTVSLGFGTSPFSYTVPVGAAGLYRVHFSDQADCNNNPFVCRDTGVECTTCPPPPPGGNCANPVNVTTLPYNETGATTCGFGITYPTSPCGGFGLDQDLVYTYTPLSNEFLNVDVSNATQDDIYIRVLDACPDDPAANCVGFADGGFGTTSFDADFALNGGTTYYILISSQFATGDCYDFDLSLTAQPIPPGVNCANPLAITSLPYNQTGATTCGFTSAYPNNTCGATFGLDADLVHTYTPLNNTYVNVAVSNATADDIIISVMDACPDDPAANCVASIDGGFGNFDADLNVILQGGTTYYIVINSQFAAGDCYNFDLDITDITPPTPSVGITNIIGGVGRANTTNAAGCDELTNMENITVEITNFGISEITAFDVNYTLGTNPMVTESWTGTLAPLATTTHTFTPTEDLSGALQSITACTVLAGDVNTADDCITTSVGNIANAPVTIDFGVPYVQDFETMPALTIDGTTDKQFAIGGVNEWDFVSTDPEGRLRTEVTEANAEPTANSGTKALVLDVNADLPFGTDPTSEAILTLNMSNYDIVAGDVFYLDFWYNDVNDEGGADDRVFVRGSCTDPWVEIYNWSGFGNTIPSGGQGTVTDLDITAALIGAGTTAMPDQNFSSSFQIAWRINADDPYEIGARDGLVVDDVQIRKVAPNDVGVTAITSRVRGRANTGTCDELTATETITIDVKNFGTADQTMIPVTFQIGAAAPVSETIDVVALTGGPLTANSTLSYTFTATGDFTTDATLTACTAFVGDSDASNDCVTENIVNILNDPVTITVGAPYVEDFEAMPELTITGTTQKQLAIGGLNAWDFVTSQAGGRLRTTVTEIPGDAAGNFGPTANSGNRGLVLDDASAPINPLNEAILTVNMSNYDANNDVFYLDFWYNDAGDEHNAGLDVVQVRGSCTDPWISVYDWSNPTFGPFSSGDFGTITDIDISAALTANTQNFSSSFQIRWTQSDNAAYDGLDGLVIDDVQIRLIPADDVSASALIAPLPQGREFTCDALGVANAVTIEIRNNGTATQTSIPVSYQIDGGTVVTETWTGSLAPSTTDTYTFTQTGNFTTASSITICTVLATDALTGDDCQTIAIQGNLPNPALTQAQFPYTQDFETIADVEIVGPASKVFAVGGINEIDFETSDASGRLRTNLGGVSVNSGNNSVMLDALGGSTPINYLYFTLNMSNFDANNDRFDLDGWFRDDGDEDTHTNDLIWVRGSCNDPWIEVFDWNTNAFGGQDVTMSDINISGALLGAGQNYSSSFQIRIGQEDDAIYNGFASDGLGIDDIVIRFIPPDPVLEVEGNATNIANGDLMPETADHTDFGDVIFPLGNRERTFTIRNTGASVLTISNVTITPTGSTTGVPFTIAQFPSSSILPGASATFRVNFVPNMLGLHEATVSIASNDPDDNPFEFGIQGNGIEPPPTMQVVGNGRNINDGDLTPTTAGSALDDHTDFGTRAVGTSFSRTFTILSQTGTDVELTGMPDLVTLTGTDPGEFNITGIPTTPIVGSTTLGIAFVPTSTGPKSAVVNIDNNDTSTGGTYTFAIQGNGAENEIRITGNGVEIVSDVAHTPNAADNTLFNSLSFGLSTFATPVAAGQDTRSYTIENTGTATLDLTGSPIVVLSNTTDFQVTTDPSASILGGASTTFEITFDPEGPAGTKTSVVSIANNDSDENPYTFNIQGEALDPAPEMEVLGGPSDTNPMAPLVLITDGDLAADATVAKGTDFGDVPLGTATPPVHTFTIRNDGDAMLNLTGTPLVVSSNLLPQFTVSAQPAVSMIAASNETTFDITFNPILPGQQTSTISIANNDADENPYDFVVIGNGDVPDLNITMGPGTGTSPPPGSPISDGVSITAGGNVDIDFFTVEVGNPITRAVNLQNNAQVQSLEITAITVVSVMGGTFNVSLLNPLSTADGLPTTAEPLVITSGTNLLEELRIEADPTAIGISQADIILTTNSGITGENEYLFTVQMNGIAPEVSVKGGNPVVEIVSGSTTPNTTDGTDFGDVGINTAGDISTFYIKNESTEDIDVLLSGISITGANASEFALVSTASSIIAPGLAGQPGDSTAFTIRFVPTALGTRTATVEILNNDLDESPYTFVIQGVGVDASTLNPTALPTELSEANLTIYPNPSTGLFRMRVDGNVNAEGAIQVFDARGGNVYNQEITLRNGETEFNLSRVAAGKYIVVIQLGKEKIARTIVKE